MRSYDVSPVTIVVQLIIQRLKLGEYGLKSLSIRPTANLKIYPTFILKCYVLLKFINNNNNNGTLKEIESEKKREILKHVQYVIYIEYLFRNINIIY